MKLELGPEIIASYKRLAYEVWYALAEFVDNSTQSYFNNREALDAAYKAEGDILTVNIWLGTDAEGPYIFIEDNSMGMSESELNNAVHIGKLPENATGRSRYGLGLKTGASWFGDLWTISTAKLGETKKHTITVDVEKVAGGELDLPYKVEDVDAKVHGTRIEIRKLNRTASAGRTLGKTKNYLRSLYRHDLRTGSLVLKVNNEALIWETMAQVETRILKRKDGTIAKHDIDFMVNDHHVVGWAALLEKGSRKSAGFSILQSNRVIMGWPKAYRPETVFGDQEGGSNDLVNQRLFGELSLDGFDVSHTKDQILFRDGEQDLLEATLAEQVQDLRQLALTYRKGADERVGSTKEALCAVAVNIIEAEIKLPAMQSVFSVRQIPQNSLIQKINVALKNAVVGRITPDLSGAVGDIKISLYLANDMSPNDPYVIIESTSVKNEVIVIVNVSHPHWATLTTEESVTNFIRHCVYDGVAESKAFSVRNLMEPDTVKQIKDGLLRVPMAMS
jgi:hypothetical protein